MFESTDADFVPEPKAVADPAIRMFQIVLMNRNQRQLVHHALPETEGLSIVGEFWHRPPVSGRRSTVFVYGECIYHDSRKTCVLRLPGASFHSEGQQSAVVRYFLDKVEWNWGTEKSFLTFALSLGSDLDEPIEQNRRSSNGVISQF